MNPTETKEPNKSKTPYECKRCGDVHFNNYSVNCSECGYTEAEIKQQKIDAIVQDLENAFDAFNTGLDYHGELKNSNSYFIDFIINKVMETYTQVEMAELVKYIALNINHCDN